MRSGTCISRHYNARLVPTQVLNRAGASLCPRVLLSSKQTTNRRPSPKGSTLGLGTTQLPFLLLLPPNSEAKDKYNIQ